MQMFTIYFQHVRYDHMYSNQFNAPEATLRPKQSPPKKALQPKKSRIATQENFYHDARSHAKRSNQKPPIHSSMPKKRKIPKRFGKRLGQIRGRVAASL
jgi:hypothetical protein